jgi:hypothetical protein
MAGAAGVYRVTPPEAMAFARAPAWCYLRRDTGAFLTWIL